MMIPGGDAYVEYDISGGEWSDAVSVINSEHVRVTKASFSLDAVRHGTPTHLISAAFRTQDPCYSETSRLIVALATAALCLGASVLFPGSQLFFWRAGALAAIGSVAAYGALRYCESQHPEYYSSSMGNIWQPHAS